MTKFLIIIIFTVVISNAQYVRDDHHSVVLDTKSGLLWEDKYYYSCVMNWDEAINKCENMSLAGYDDWRLPNFNELFSLLDTSRYNPAVSSVFKNFQTYATYWTSTYDPVYAGRAWYVWFRYNGGVGSWMTGYSGYCVRCVRGN